MSLSIDSFVQKCNEDPAVHPRSVMVWQDGEIIAKHLWLLDERRNVHSVTKSITSCAVGIALRDGFFSMDDKIVSYFERELPLNPDPRLFKMTVRDFLTMTSGFKNPMDAEFRFAVIENFPRYILGKEIAHDAGTHFLYNTACTYLIGCIIQKTTGVSLRQYVSKNVLEPIGILNVPWPESRDGVALGGSGIMLTTEEMITLGRFWLQHGEWEGKQIVPREYFDQATKTITVVPEHDGMSRRGYGYYFWTDRFKAFPRSFFAFGSWGKYLVVVPEKNAVIAVTAHDPRNLVTAHCEILEGYIESELLSGL